MLYLLSSGLSGPDLLVAEATTHVNESAHYEPSNRSASLLGRFAELVCRERYGIFRIDRKTDRSANARARQRRGSHLRCSDGGADSQSTGGGQNSGGTTYC